jgi:hypothetical protein
VIVRDTSHTEFVNEHLKFNTGIEIGLRIRIKFVNFSGIFDKGYITGVM